MTEQRLARAHQKARVARRTIQLRAGSPLLLDDPAIGINNSAPTYTFDVLTGDIGIGTLGKTLRINESTNGKQGTAVLVAGSKVVANTSITANSRIQLTSNVDGGTPGFLRVSARTVGTSFTITSSSGTDTSTVAYLITEPY